MKNWDPFYNLQPEVQKIILELAEKYQLPRATVTHIILSPFRYMREEGTKRLENVQIPNFGSFLVLKNWSRRREEVKHLRKPRIK
jgi:nucleoid DNA-binding protein